MIQFSGKRLYFYKVGYMKYILKTCLYVYLNFILFLFIAQYFSGGNSDLIISMYIFIVIVFVILNEKLNTMLEKLDNLEKSKNDKNDERIEK